MNLFEIATRQVNPDDVEAGETILAVSGPIPVGSISKIDQDGTEVKFRVEDSGLLRILDMTLGDAPAYIGLVRDQDVPMNQEMGDVDHPDDIPNVLGQLVITDPTRISIMLLGINSQYRYVVNALHRWKAGDFKDVGKDF